MVQMDISRIRCGVDESRYETKFAIIKTRQLKKLSGKKPTTTVIQQKSFTTKGGCFIDKIFLELFSCSDIRPQIGTTTTTITTDTRPPKVFLFFLLALFLLLFCSILCNASTTTTSKQRNHVNTTRSIHQKAKSLFIFTPPPQHAKESSLWSNFGQEEEARNLETDHSGTISDRLFHTASNWHQLGEPRRRQSSSMSPQATLLSHKQNLLTGSANINPSLASPYNQFYLTNNVNSPHNVISSLLTSPWITPLSLKETCTTASDNRAGMCMPKKACLASGGYVAGTCGILGACCVYQGTCRTIIAANETYFVSPAYPSMHKERLDPPICIFTLQRTSPAYNKWPVCQFKLSFDEFTLAPPINGTCGGKTDAFIVSGAVNFNTSGLPTAGICGDISGQHMYLDVDPEQPDEPLLLIVNTANEQRYNRRWSIRVQQIACHSPYRAPNGCLQYYTSETGIIESFNYRGTGRASAFPGSSVLPLRSVPQYPTLQFISSPNYFNDLYYGVCIQKQPRMCAIKWQAMHFDFGGTLAGLSDVSAPNSQTYGCVRNDGLALYGSDLGDYISIQGASRDGRFRLQSQFCGQRLNSLPQQDMNDEIVSYAKPFTMIVRTDNLAGLHALPQAPKSQKGFRLKYKQLACK